ncbi:MAG: substrate-binding domain-containing protein, partial [Anaerotignaceae bacterium]
NTFSKINEDIALYCTTVTYDTEIKTPGIEYSVGYNLAVECIKKTPDVTALVAINDMVAFGVIDAIINLGYNIPKDYSVCGFDNILPSKFNGISLTTIDHSIFERGRNAFKLLMHKIHDEKEKSNSEVITKVEYQSKLVVRNSTGTPRKYEIEPTLIKN